MSVSNRVYRAICDYRVSHPRYPDLIELGDTEYAAIEADVRELAFSVEPQIREDVTRLFGIRVKRVEAPSYFRLS